MNPFNLLLVLLLLSSVGYFMGRRKAFAVAGGNQGLQKLHSRPVHYGALTALWCGIPALVVYAAWLAIEPAIITRIVLDELPAEIQSLSQGRINLLVNDIRNLIAGNIVSAMADPVIQAAADRYAQLKRISDISLASATVSLGLLALFFVRSKIVPALRARNQVERIVRVVLLSCSMIAIFTTIGIVLSVLYESIRFFKAVPLTDFLFGLDWSPQMAIRSDQVGSSGAFGAVPVLAGTVMISMIAMAVAAPIGLMSAIYLSEYANRRVRAVVKPLMEILAGIPTVVYGFFAALTVAPFIRNSGAVLGLDVSSESAMAAGLVMGVMIIPFVSSLSDDVINAVPQSLRDGAYALGATRSETVRHVIIPAAFPGIVGSLLLAVSRAIGETMIVVMAAGLSANLTANPFQAVTTVTVQIVTLLVGDQEFDSPKTLAAFALGLLLFLVTLVLNVVALVVVRKYREQYE
ncbi:phosphate ABC transporter permease subunit PstC [Desulfosarcina sp.]|uniref:phosphate ABC transporter permease subunit PstC n=1 Tax=Desulfosarcina sp. TaxID=2027861 RepID=UPI003970E064